jgi:hypothetical protein
MHIHQRIGKLPAERRKVSIAGFIVVSQPHDALDVGVFLPEVWGIERAERGFLVNGKGGISQFLEKSGIEFDLARRGSEAPLFIFLVGRLRDQPLDLFMKFLKRRIS